MSLGRGLLISHVMTQKQQGSSAGEEKKVWFISRPLNRNSTTTFTMSAFKRKSPKILCSSLTARVCREEETDKTHFA